VEYRTAVCFSYYYSYSVNWRRSVLRNCMINREGIVASFGKNYTQYHDLFQVLSELHRMRRNFGCTVSILGRRIQVSTVNLFKKE
jgi:hypothetical protein